MEESKLQAWYIRRDLATISIIDDEKRTIAILPLCDDGALERAALMAAAPDLYRVILKMAIWCERLKMDNQIKDYIQDARRLIEDPSLLMATYNAPDKHLSI